MTVNMGGGEVSSNMYARVDLAAYGTWLKQCKNWVVQPYGGLKNRSGTKYIATTKTTGDRVRLIPFTFNTEQTYVIEMGDRYARFYRNGEIIRAPITVTAENIGTGDGGETVFELTDSPNTVQDVQTCAVYVDGVLQTDYDDVNLFTDGEAVGSWTLGTGVTVTNNSWTPPGTGGATGDTINWS